MNALKHKSSGILPSGIKLNSSCFLENSKLDPSVEKFGLNGKGFCSAKIPTIDNSPLKFIIQAMEFVDTWWNSFLDKTIFISV